MGGLLSLVLIPSSLGLALLLAILPVLGVAPNSPPLPNPQPQPVLPITTAPSLAEQFTPTVRYWSADIHQWSNEYRLPTSWIAVVMQIESCGHPRIFSRAGAAGLFQVMPFHFLPGEDPLSVPINAARGLAYLARAFELSGGDSAATLAGYNGGHGMIGRPMVEWPAETRRYVHWGTGILDDLAASRMPSPTLTEWLASGGSRLCQIAEQELGVFADTAQPIS
ncbi:MAG: hypothetical protein A2W26_04570 [Acidobacteria bacterium RBG_16_64_8]|nr:MAG: hypothetical protein A2W26_04570 [Acidobacteria bacterium RBG_16_64_8]